MKKYKLILEYDGTAYLGWQSQLNDLSIQEVVEKALKKITKIKTNVHASGRTDSGVHAEAQIAHFSSNSKMTARQFHRALNSMLPHDITIRDVVEVSKEFNSRRDAKSKIYRYTLLNRTYPSALHYKRCWYIYEKLNISNMKRAARLLVGKHDFHSFRAAKSSAKSSIKEIYSVVLKKRGDFLEITFEGNSFLKHMVRNLVGTLVWVGKGYFKYTDVVEILNAKDRRKAGPKAPPQELCLIKVIYD